MRTIRGTSAFKRDYKREKKGRFSKRLDMEVRNTVAALAAGLCPNAITIMPWPDHGRITATATFGPIWILIYRKPGAG